MRVPFWLMFPLMLAIAHNIARSRGLEPLPAAPARWLDEVSPPQAPAGRFRRCVVRDVVRRVLPVGHRPALLDHPGVHIGAVDTAHRDDAPVAVAVTLGALDRPAGDALAEGSGGGFATRPCLAAGTAALRPLRCVDAVEPAHARENRRRPSGVRNVRGG